MTVRRIVWVGMAVCAAAAAIGLTLGQAAEPDGKPLPVATPAPPIADAQAVIPSRAGGLSLPIDCRPGVDCAVQNYVDSQPGGGATDHRCGTRSYDDHNGTDFRLLNEAQRRQGVAVLAARDGTVLRVRDGVPDVSVTERGLAAVAGQECGNGVVLDHGNGLTTQYCHLASGSLRVRAGQAVGAGDALGSVGLSGQTEYPHLHFTVRRGDVVVDPFAPDAVGRCSAAPGPSLWTGEAAARLAYQSRSVLNAGFSDVAPTMASIEAGALARPATSSPALIAYVRAIGLKAGDVERLILRGPDGSVLAEGGGDPLPRDRAQQMIFAGRRTPAQGWASGAYTAIYTVTEGQTVVLRHVSEIRL